MNYDEYKTENPFDNEHLENECAMCGESTDGVYCSKKCRNADEI
jgi:hypothetical protein